MLYKGVCTITDLVAVRDRARMGQRRDVHLPKVADKRGFAVERTGITAALPSAVEESGAVWRI
jgi:hypothetical protein